MGGRGGRPLAARRRARAVQDDRRRRHLETRAHGPRALRGSGGGVRGGHRSRGPRHALRRALCAAAHPVVLCLGAGGHGRKRPGRDLQERRRRRHLAQDGQRAARGHGAHRDRRLTQEPEDRLRGGPELRGRVERQRRRAQPQGRGLPLGGWRRDLDPHQPPQPAAVLLQPDPRRSRERAARLRPGFRAARLGGRGPDLPRGPLREGPSRQPRPGRGPA